MILDPMSDKDRVRAMLKKMLATMDKLQEQAFTYKNYQKNFKVCDGIIMYINHHRIFRINNDIID